MRAHDRRAGGTSMPPSASARRSTAPAGSARRTSTMSPAAVSTATPKAASPAGEARSPCANASALIAASTYSGTNGCSLIWNVTQ
ncbi:hypothetical protein [Dactylosporangium darangshiense]|uniref:hypothetical protein n=1 Tax=Dactylosporangium darangshiense TaxID=579108 RepID=UPI0031F1A718